MNSFKKLLAICFFISVTHGFASNGGKKSPPLVDKIAITTDGTNRVFTFTNKKFGQFHGETNEYTQDGWRGWVCREQKIFTDYTLSNFGKPLDRAAAKVSVFPYKVVRQYNGDISEEIFFADSLDLLALTLKNAKAFDFSFFAFAGIDGQIKSDRHLQYSLSSILPGFYLSVISNAPITLSPIEKNGSFHIANPAKETQLVFIIHTKPLNEKQILKDLSRLEKQKKDRINRLLERSEIRTNNPDFDKAYLWAVASYDALVTEQESKGIFAGLPWFNNNWGRDTFISLPGCFVTGNFEDARQILEAFAAYQDTNPSSVYYGRIPNRVTLKDVIYNTTDGTPWFVIQAYAYFQYTGDTAFLKRIFPKIKLAFTGTIKNYVDESGFLTHRDAETWMDAVGPDGPWSPRGNRAVDIQVLWFKQLETTGLLAKMFGDAALSNDCAALLTKLKQNFNTFFINAENATIADRIMKDDTKDFRVRPNLLFALNEKSLIENDALRMRVLRNTMSNIITPYGVLSLDYKDKNFHPYHEYAPFYPKDAAYHNGIIWQWNSGPAVEALCNALLPDSAWKLTSELTRQIQHEWAAGTIAELMEAMPRKDVNNIRMSGAFSQAWSLAEYLRTISQCYFGIKPDAPNHLLNIAPRLPADIKDASFVIRYKQSKIRMSYTKTTDSLKIQLQPLDDVQTLTLRFSVIAKNYDEIKLVKRIAGKGKYEFVFPLAASQQPAVTINSNNLKMNAPVTILRQSQSVMQYRDSLRFARIESNRQFPVLKEPDYEMLPHQVIKTEKPANAEIIADASDPSGDEAYTYPQHPFFIKGILDLTHFTLSGDSLNYYFEMSFTKLSNPNWHAEYGFQLTIAGIYFQTSAHGALGYQAGKNSKHEFASGRGFNRVVYVGGGVEIRDGENNILAAYLPQAADVKNPLGSVIDGKIHFSIPHKLLGDITKNTKISVLVGGQDDHGGSGLGEFREVHSKAEEWSGGGKNTPGAHNVYDFLFIN